MAQPYYFQGVQYGQPQVYQPVIPTPQVAPQVTPPTVPQHQSNQGVNWVQGEAGAKSYPVAPNTSVLLMDSENSVMYIKTADASGMPLPLRIFDYTERTPQNAHNGVAEPKTDTVTREEFESLKSDVMRLTKGIRKPQVNTKNEKEG